ncbi:MAG: type II secretion system protein [Planctomycetota bacterium]|nr:MAG: type II secretion system protein [Planctomycetota bacterium]
MRLHRGMSLIEVTVAGSLLLVLVGASFGFMGTHLRLARQQEALAAATVRSQRAFDAAAGVIRRGVLVESNSTLCTDPNTHNFARLAFHLIDPALPFANGKLNVDTARVAYLEAVDEQGRTVARTHDGESGTAPSLRYGVDTDGDGTADEGLVVLARDVARFWVEDQGSALSLQVEVRAASHESRGAEERASTSAWTAVTRYDPASME